VEAIENTGEARIGLRLGDLEAGDMALRQGDVEGLLVIPPGFERDLKGGRQPADLLVVSDGTNAFAAGQIQAAIRGALARFAQTALGHQVAGAAPVELRKATYFEITRVQDPVSTQMGFLLYQMVLMVAALSLARERESGTLEQLLVTPLSRLELIAGKALPAMLVGAVNFWVLYVVGRAIYAMPLRGSLALLFGCALLFVAAETAWGVFLSSRVANQQQAVQLIFLQILFDLSFSGYVVPVENLPRFLSWISELLPVRHYIECVRIVMLRGGKLGAVGVHVGALLALNLGYWGLSIAVLRQKLD
jgi:ABC-2 type transport system permease protein